MVFGCRASVVGVKWSMDRTDASSTDRPRPADRGRPNRWADVDHALAYLGRADSVPHRTEGEAELLSLPGSPPGRVLDLGCGDGRLMALVLTAFPEATGVALDFNDEMLARASERFEGGVVRVLRHDLSDPLPPLGSFDAVVSSFAVHHLPHDRKRSLYGEVFARLRPGGLFANLEHVSSPTERLHRRFLAELGVAPADDDPSNILLDVETQLRWLRQGGFVDVDCHWKWRELALLAGWAPDP
jgi:SAM-dependent methyltransferase